VVAFFITSAKTKSFNVDALKGQAVVKQLRDTVENIQKQIGIRIFEQAARVTCPRWKLCCLSRSWCSSRGEFLP